MAHSANKTEGHDEHGHLPQLQHHFDTPEQQFESGKLGMWIFLATEILLFGGLFCAYSVYRSNHPEIFVYAHQYLDVPLGALNTMVLIFSSFTMAWAVRCSQLNQTKALITLLSITLFCGFVFLGVKYVEYEHKWKDGLLWGELYNPTHHGEEITHSDNQEQSEAHSQSTSLESESSSDAQISNATPGEEKSLIPDAAVGPKGLSPGEHETSTSHGKAPSNVHIFFGIYFAMTGLHGVHVIVGMIAIGWLVVRSIKGHFSSDYYTPVDMVGLYWHLVDLIWIYLFPLLYLIG